MRHPCAAAALLLIALGCEPIGDEENLPTPSCEPGELAVFGTVEGASLSTSLAFDGHSFVNKLSDDPGVVELSESGDVLLRLEFDRAVADGESVAASGFLDLTSLGEPRVGNCAADGRVSELTKVDDGVEFRLIQARVDPFCGTGETTTLVGCANWADTGGE